MATDFDDDFPRSADGFPDNPQAQPLGFGEINVPQESTVEKTENMPFDGYIAGIDLIGWPAGANNAIGFNIRVEGSNPIIPKNFEPGTNEFVSADNAVGEITVIEPDIDRGDEIEVAIRNGSTTNALDLNPLIVTVTNFNPLLLSTIN